MCATVFFVVLFLPFLLTFGVPHSCSVGLKATLVLAVQIRRLSSEHPHYKDNAKLQENVANLTAFTLDEQTLKTVWGGVSRTSSLESIVMLLLIIPSSINRIVCRLLRQAIRRNHPPTLQRPP